MQFMLARLSCTSKRKFKVWFRRNQNVSTKIYIDHDSDIDDLKEAIFGATGKDQYQATYNYKLLRPLARVPQNTTRDMPIVFTRIGPAPPPGLDCGGDPCGNCGKCHDWHFTGDQEKWDWICNYKNWIQVDKERWNDGDYNLFQKRPGAACSRDLNNNFGGRRDPLLNDRLNDLDRNVFLDHLCLCEKH
ncbi:unnamed protein product [Adineta steineri]|uniref:Uncharacterized protein n=1 Tax=Adineta steineri TaxID=433720 RepID=A0A814YPN6_9BILA|nr:unnamed protein product [Adineta steineri]